MLITKIRACTLMLCLLAVVGVGCRRDMQDQPRYEVYERSTFFNDNRASRNLPDNVVPRGYLREDDHLYRGKFNTDVGGGTRGAGGSTQSSGNDQTGAALQGNQNAGQNEVGQRPDTGDSVASPGSAATQSDPNNVDTFPFPVTKEVLDRGQERYQVFCMMCHGMTGYGDGMVVRRGYKRPTSYHDDRLRGERVGHFYDVITKGWGSMPNYAAQITPRDRWAITAYIRTLQLSQGATLADVPEAERRQFEGAADTAPQGEVSGEEGR